MQAPALSIVIGETILGIHLLYLVQGAVLVGIAFTAHYTTAATWWTPQSFSSAGRVLFAVGVSAAGAVIVSARLTNPCGRRKGVLGSGAYEPVQPRDDSSLSALAEQGEASRYTWTNTTYTEPGSQSLGSSGMSVATRVQEVTHHDATQGFAMGAPSPTGTPLIPVCRGARFPLPMCTVLTQLTLWMVCVTPLVTTLVAIDTNWFVIPCLCSVTVSTALFIPVRLAAVTYQGRAIAKMAHSSSLRDTAFNTESNIRRMSKFAVLFMVCVTVLAIGGMVLVSTGTVDTPHVVSAACAFIVWLLIIAVDTDMVNRCFKNVAAHKGKVPAPPSLSAFLGLSVFIRMFMSVDPFVPTTQ
jgi:hypothetical protein